MGKRRTFWLIAAGVALAGVAALTPGSPVYAPGIFIPKNQHGGKTADQWIAGLRSSDVTERERAIRAVGSIGPDAADAVPALADILLEDPDRNLRSQAALTLMKMAPASSAAVTALAKALADDEPFVRMNAAMALFRIGPDARPAIPALAAALADDANHTNLATFHFTIQEMAAHALGRASAGQSDGLAALTAALQRADTAELRAAIVGALGEIGAPARSAAPPLRRLLKDANAELRQSAEEALKRIGAEAAGDDIAGAEPPDMELPESERTYIWDIEHHGNLLVKHGFSALAAALQQADAAALDRLMAADFTGRALRDPQRIHALPGFIQAERLQQGAPKPVDLTRDELIARLLELRRTFPGPPQVKFSLMNLGPKVRREVDGPWIGSALVRMFGDHAKGAPAEISLIVQYEIPRPTQAALAQPDWLRGLELRQITSARSPARLFAEVAQERGLHVSRVHDNWNSSKFQPTTGGVFVADYDRDGILDVLITDVTGVMLYRGRPGGQFEDVTIRMGLPQRPPSVTSAAWADLDGDGWEDLILAGRIYRNEQGKRLVDVTDRSNLRIPSDASNLVVADYDRDGKLDLYVTRTGPPGGRSWLDDKTSDPKGNVLYRNQGDWQFDDVTRAAGAGGGRRSTFTAAWLDANNDGWPDLHVPNEFGDGVLLVNQGNGTFREHALADRPADYGTMGMATGDIDNDGHIDIFCNNMFSKAGTRVIANLASDAYPPQVMEKMRRFVGGSQLHLNQGGLKFAQAGPTMQVNSVGWSYGACLADLDNDGWLDIYATAGFISKSRTEPDG